MPAMSCATPNAQCWWCATDGAIAIRRYNAARSIDRTFFQCADRGTRPSPKASEFRIRKAPDSLLDMAAHQPDVAEFAIVQLPQRFDRRPAIQVSYDCVRPNPEPAERSARTEGNCRLCCGLGHRGHWSSPVGHSTAKECRRRAAGNQRLRPGSDCSHSPQCNLRLDRFNMIRYKSRCK